MLSNTVKHIKKHGAIVLAMLTIIIVILIIFFPNNNQKANALTESNFVDIEIAAKGLSKMESFLAALPVKRKWVKAKIKLNGSTFDAKLKFHGTSSAHFINEKYSYAIKLKKDSLSYLDNARKFKLIKSEEADPSIIAINKMAHNLGLISTSGRMVILRINGVEKGCYYLVEDIKKEYLERELGITNYSTLVNVTDWTRKENISTGINHISENDLHFGHVEMKNDLHFAKALHQYKILSQHIIDGNIDAVKPLFDLDYMARFLALATVFNDIHFLTGDNLKLVYDFNRGKFYPIYRAECEGRVIKTKWSTTFPNFNKFLFHSLGDLYANSVNTSLFRLLLTDNELRNERDQYIYNFIINRSEFEDDINSVYASNDQVMHYIDSTWLRFEPKKALQFSIINSTLTLAKDYLDYAQIYVTYDSTMKALHLLLDAYSPIDILCDTVGFEKRKVNGLRLNQNLNPVYLYQTYNIESENFDPETLIFVNHITKDTLHKKQIYINYIDQSPQSISETAEHLLKQNKIAYQRIQDSLIILSGTYNINSDIIIQPGLTTLIQRGTIFKMAPGVNFSIHGSVTIEGSSNQPVIIKNAVEKVPFGCFSIIGSSALSYANINYLSVSGGSESYFEGRLFTGQFAIYNSNVTLLNSLFENSRGDDGLNAKYCKITIDNCIFSNNYADQVDLDFCFARVSNSIFSPSLIDHNGDGLDLSGTYAEINACAFSNFLDKGLSLGEKSRVLISSCQFKENNIAIAIKDQTKIFTWENSFDSNQVDLYSFIKKPIFNAPELNIMEAKNALNLKIVSGHFNELPDSVKLKESVTFKAFFDIFKADGHLSNKVALNKLIES